MARRSARSIPSSCSICRRAAFRAPKPRRCCWRLSAPRRSSASTMPKSRRRSRSRAQRVAGDEERPTMNARSRRALRSRGDPRRVPDPRRAPLWQAAGLSRQRRLGAEAARGPRPAHPFLRRTNTPTFIAACIISPMPRPTPTRRRAKACAAFSTPARSKRSCSRARRPRRSISSPRASASNDIGEGDEIVLSVMEHHANIVPWHF